MVEKSDEEGITCPTNLKWLRGMLSILPEELRGKLAPYSACLESYKKTEPEEKKEKEKEKVEEKIGALGE